MNSAVARSAHVCTPASLQGGIFIRPRAAIVAEGEHNLQRRFGPDRHSAFGLRLKRHPDTEVEICRIADEDTAGLKITIGRRRSASIEADLTPDDMIELAARLIDAAHDIQANPAKGLLASMARARARAAA